MALSKISAFLGSCSLICFALSATLAQAQMSTEHQLGVLGTDDSQLDTGSYFDTYETEGVEGQRVAISLDSSEFNAFLRLSLYCFMAGLFQRRRYRRILG